MGRTSGRVRNVLATACPAGCCRTGRTGPGYGLCALGGSFYALSCWVRLVVLHLLPLLVGGRVAPARTVHEEILGKPFNVYDFLAVLDIEGVEVAPKGFFPESLEYTMDTSRMPR